jgi:hypothetical protein
VDTALSRNEFDPQDIKLSIDEYKIFEIKGYQLASSSLMAGSSQTRHITTIEEVTPQNIGTLKHRILGVLIPPDVEKLRLLRQEMALDPKNNKIKSEFESLLQRSIASGLMQVKDYHPDERKLEVRTTSLDPLPSNYLLVSNFKLEKIV